jgi:DNA processing protein
MTLPTPQLLAILTELEIAGLAQSSDNFQFYFNGEP